MNYKLKWLKDSFTTKNKINEEIISMICGNLGEIYKDGIRINDAIEILEEAIFDKSYKKSLNRIVIMLKSGKTLSDSFKVYEGIYPTFFIGMISIGENSGKLYEILMALKIYYEKCAYIKKEIRKAISYPICVLICLAALIIFIFKSIIPNVIDVYASMNIIPSKKCLILFNISELINKDIFIFLIYFIVYGIIMPILIAKCCIKKINVDIMHNINIIKTYFEYEIILMLFIVSSSKLNISYGLRVCEKSIDSKYIKLKLKQINNKIINGSTLCEAVKSIDIMSKYAIAVIRMREESGSLEAGLKELCLKFQKNISNKMNKILSSIQPILIVFLSFLISIFLVVVILPIFQGVQGIIS